jgi:uncharacterized protein (DUF2267 family)
VDAQRFSTLVQEAAGVDEAHAARAIAATLATLAERLDAGEVADVAAELPKAFAGLLPRGPWVEQPTADEFAQRLAHRTALDRERAMRAAEAVVETLAERISGGEIDDLDSRLPLELHPALERGRVASGDHARSMPLQSFLRRVAEREGVPPAEALVHARAVLATLREAVGDEEFLDVISELPADYKRILVPVGGRSR